MNDFNSRARGAVLGMAIGDALGAPVEFMPPGTFPSVTDFAPTPRWNLEAGVYTDDTIMGICLADALIASRGYDSWTVMDEYDAWYSRGKNTPHNYCFDIGNQTAQSIMRYRSPLSYIMEGEPRGDAAGNGSIMRLAPAAIVAARGPSSVGDRLLSYSGRETHYSTEAEQATVIYGRMIGAALRGEVSKQEILESASKVDDAHGLLDLLRQTTAATPVSGAGYVRLSVQAAWWAFLSTESYEDCVLAAVNLGDDADTTAAIAGQLAGAYYALESMPLRWTEAVWNRDKLLKLADDLCEVPCTIVRTRFQGDEEYGRPT